MKRIAIVDYLAIIFIALILLFGFDGDIVTKYVLVVLVTVLVVSYLALSKLISNMIVSADLLDNIADKEEMDKEVSFLIILGACFLLINNLQFLIGIMQIEVSLTGSVLNSINNFLNMLLLITIELLVFSTISYLFGFKKTSGHNQNLTSGANNSSGIYSKSYTCEETLISINNLNNSVKSTSTSSNDLIAPIQLLLNTTKVVLAIVAIVFIPIIFDLEGADYIKNLAASLGGSVAVLAFVFREGLKPFAAAVSIHMNDLMKVGDKIKSKKLNINGKVQEISSTNIKFKNKDHTITNVPTDKLLSSPFYNLSTIKNLGRRVDLTILVHIPTIKKIDFKNITIKEPLLENYYHCKNKEDLSTQRYITNIGSYRAYLKAYLYNHGLIQKDRNIIVRSLNKTDSFGFVPIQILAYTLKEIKETKEFRIIESDIMDHALSKLADFDLHATSKQ